MGDRFPIEAVDVSKEQGTRSNTMKKYIIVIVVIAIVIIVAGIVDAVVFAYRDEPATLTIQQFIEEFPCASKDFKSYDPGDSLAIVSKVAIIMTEHEYHGNYNARGSTYNGTDYDNLLYVWLKTDRGHSGFTFGANELSIISDYRNSTHVGDTITIDIQIIDAKSDDWRNEYFIGHVRENPDLKILYFVPWLPMPPVPGL